MLYRVNQYILGNCEDIQEKTNICGLFPVQSTTVRLHQINTCQYYRKCIELIQSVIFKSEIKSYKFSAYVHYICVNSITIVDCNLTVQCSVQNCTLGYTVYSEKLPCSVHC